MGISNILLVTFVKSILPFESLMNYGNTFVSTIKILDIASTMGITFLILLLLLPIGGALLYGLFLWISSKIIKVEKNNYFTAFVTCISTIFTVILFSFVLMSLSKLVLFWTLMVFLLPLLISVIFIKLFYKESWKKTIVLFLLFFAILFLMNFVFTLIGYNFTQQSLLGINSTGPHFECNKNCTFEMEYQGKVTFTIDVLDKDKWITKPGSTMMYYQEGESLESKTFKNVNFDDGPFSEKMLSTNCTKMKYVIKKVFSTSRGSATCK